MEPEDRPTFKELCSSVAKFTEGGSGDLQANPFTGGKGKGEEEGKEWKEGKEG